MIPTSLDETAIPHKDFAHRAVLQRCLRDVQFTLYIVHSTCDTQWGIGGSYWPPHGICSKQTDTAPCKEKLVFLASWYRYNVHSLLHTDHDSVFGVSHGPQNLGKGRSCFSYVSLGLSPRLTS